MVKVLGYDVCDNGVVTDYPPQRLDLVFDTKEQLDRWRVVLEKNLRRVLKKDGLTVNFRKMEIGR